MNRDVKLKLMLLSILLIGIVTFIKINSKDDKVITIDIDSSYSDQIKIAEKIMQEKREYVYIDRRIKINPVVYDLQLDNYDYDAEKTKEHFIKEKLWSECINEISESAGIEINQVELNEYKHSYISELKECKKERMALFNGFDSFEDYLESEKFENESLIKMKYDKLLLLSHDELIKYSKLSKDAELENFDNILQVKLEESYKKYINKNRY